MHFVRNDDLINSFWIKLTFSILAISKNKYINKYLPGSCHIWVILVELSQVIQSVGHFTWLIPPFSLGCWLCWSLWKGHNKYRQGQKCPSYHNIQRAHSKLWKKIMWVNTFLGFYFNILKKEQADFQYVLYPTCSKNIGGYLILLAYC